jgi:ArsR family transcriptional regulator
MSDLADRLKALADPARLAIIEFLRAPRADCCSRGDGVCACDLEGVLELSQPTVSHHMKVLVTAGLVRAEKRGRWVYYELDAAGLDRLVDDVDRLRLAPPVLG